MSEQKKIALVDLSSIFWRFYHASAGDLQNSARQKTLAFVNDLFAGFDEIKICVDCPPYKRKTLYSEYKSNRKERPLALIEDLKRVQEELVNKGWNLLTCSGAEADDIIATYCYNNNTHDITIFGTDKDLLQIFGRCENVQLYDAFAKKYKTAQNTLDVQPAQVVDYLALVGDKSDNIPGLPRCGPVNAKKLLSEFSNLKNIQSHCYEKECSFSETVRTSFISNEEQINLSYALAMLDYNCEIVETKGKMTKMDCVEFKENEILIEEKNKEEAEENTNIVASRVIDVDYKQSLAPVGLSELKQMSKILFDSGLYSNSCKNGQGAMAVIMAGRELGLGPIASLSSVSIVKGHPCISAQAMLALILASGKAEYFECVETTNEIATFETKRKGGRNSLTMSFTMDDARRAGLANKDNYKNYPAPMLRWRDIAQISRLIYPDLLLGVYCAEELNDE